MRSKENHMLGLLRLISVGFFVALSSVAMAQNNGTVTNHALPIGKGAGVQGFGSLLLGSGQIAIGQTSADPTAVIPSGDVTIGTTGVTAIGANKVTNAQLRQSGALSLIGRSANSTGNVADIQATAGSSCVFMESASTLACGAIATASIAANAVTFAKIQQVAASSIVGNPTGSLANSQGITLGSTLAFSGSALQTVAHTGDITTAANSFATTIAANAVTNAKMAQAGAATIKMNATASTANVADSTIQGLTNLTTPSATLDFIPIYDHATGLIKNVTPGAIASSAVAGVASLNTLTGALSIGAGSGISVTPSGSTVTVARIVTATTSSNNGGAASTASTVGVMAGQGAGCVITPAFSTKVQVEWYYTGRINTTAGTVTTKIWFGTGTAPTQGAATTGTQIGGQLATDEPSPGNFIGAANSAIATGLTPGTAYWFDLSYATANASNTAQLGSINCILKEL